MRSEVPLHQEDSQNIGTLVSQDLSEMGNDTGGDEGHVSELKTLSNIGVQQVADGEYLCIANNSRKTSNRSIRINGLHRIFTMKRLLFNNFGCLFTVFVNLVASGEAQAVAYVRFSVSLEDVRGYLGLVSPSEFEFAFLNTLVRK